VVAVVSVPAATGTAVSLAFAEPVPASRKRPDAVVITDDLAAHEAEMVRAALDRVGLGRRHLPPHSPDPDPIGRT
jgi:hypothetical protein